MSKIMLNIMVIITLSGCGVNIITNFNNNNQPAITKPTQLPMAEDHNKIINKLMTIMDKPKIIFETKHNITGYEASFINKNGILTPIIYSPKKHKNLKICTTSQKLSQLNATDLLQHEMFHILQYLLVEAEYKLQRNIPLNAKISVQDFDNIDNIIRKNEFSTKTGSKILMPLEIEAIEHMNSRRTIKRKRHFRVGDRSCSHKLQETALTRVLGLNLNNPTHYRYVTGLHHPQYKKLNTIKRANKILEILP